jgi:pilus assembly protein CpaE
MVTFNRQATPDSRGPGMKGSALRLLVVAGNDAARRIGESIAARRDVQIVGTATDTESTLLQASALDPDVFLVDDTLPLDGPLPVIQQIMARNPHATVVVIASPATLEFVRQAMLAGARGFVMRPVSGEVLVQTLAQAFEVERQRREMLARQSPTDGRLSDPGQVVALTSLKGGVGNTFLAVNLAVALQRQSKRPVALVEGPPGGDMAVLLNLRPTYTLSDLIPQLANLDAELLTGALTAHQSGLKVLPYRLPALAASPASPEALVAVVRHLQGIFGFVVLDAASLWGESLAALLEVADTAFIVATPEMPTLRRAAILYENAQAIGFPTGRLRLVVNRATEEGGISARDIASRLQIPNPLSIAADRPAAVYSVNRGIPIVLSNERHPVARGIMSLAKEVLALAMQGNGNETMARGGPGLFSGTPRQRNAASVQM